MLGSADLVAFVPATDPAATRDFYKGTLGLRLVEETPFACVFQAPNATLRAAIVETVAPAPYTVAGWTVGDIAEAARELASRGVELERYDGLDQDAGGVWQSPGGAQVAWFKDPDGNTLSLTQP